MEKHHKFSIWYILLGIWVVLLLQNILGSAFATGRNPEHDVVRVSSG